MKLFGVYASLVTLLIAGNAFAKEALVPTLKLIESFESYEVGKFPKAMKTYPFQRSKAKKVYKVAQEGDRKFLRAEDNQDLSIQTIRQFHWDIKKYPWLSWQWRARTLPTGGDERDGSTNDSACGVYTVFGKYSGKALKYVWSSIVPVGHVVKKKPGKFHMIVMKTGPEDIGQEWHRVAINVAADHQTHFGSKAKNPTGFALLTDGNAVHKPAACDYDEFVVHAAKPF